MRIITKLFIGFSALAVLLQIFSLSYFVLAPAVLAEEDSDFDIAPAVIRVPFWDLPSEFKTFSFEPCPQECLPTDAYETCEAKKIKTCLNIPWIAMYIGAAFRYAVVLGSILGVLMIMLGGTLYLIGGFNQNMIKTGKDFISGAVIGLILLLGSYILLNAINPNFVSLKPVRIEVVKEQALAKMLACSEAVQQGYVVDDPNWKTDTVCGAMKDVKYTGSDPAKMVAGQKCRDDSCGNTGKACVQDFDTGEYSCKSVAMYGKITYPDALTLAGCGELVNALTTKGFYIDELRLMKLTTSGQQLPVTDTISVGSGKQSYSIEKGALPNDLAPGDRLYLWIEVNDAAWKWYTLGMTSDDEFLTAAKTKDLNGASEVVPITFCGSGSDAKMYGISVTDKKGLAAYTIPTLTGADIKKAVNGVRWDIDITKEFFNCQGGETKEPPTIDCQFVGGGTVGAKGDSCTGTEDTCQTGLVCNSVTKICSAPGKTNDPCTIDNECQADFYCNSSNKCEAMGSEWTTCDPDNNKSCKTGLICGTHDDLGGKPVCVTAPKGCKVDDDCKNVDGWNQGSCDDDPEDMVCDCGPDSDCAKDYICVDNEWGLFGGNDSCVKKPQ